MHECQFYSLSLSLSFVVLMKPLENTLRGSRVCMCMPVCVCVYVQRSDKKKPHRSICLSYYCLPHLHDTLYCHSKTVCEREPNTWKCTFIKLNPFIRSTGDFGLLTVRPCAARILTVGAARFVCVGSSALTKKFNFFFLLRFNSLALSRCRRRRAYKNTTSHEHSRSAEIGIKHKPRNEKPKTEKIERVAVGRRFSLLLAVHHGSTE